MTDRRPDFPPDRGGRVAGAGGARDPVCGMAVDPATAKHTALHAGDHYYFCGPGCKAKFVADPAKYLRPAQREEAQLRAGVVYTCPMHPAIRRTEPGDCPICGMGLEPAALPADGPNAELIDMRRRLGIGAVLAAPVLVLAMGAHMPALMMDRFVPPRLSIWIQFVLATPVVLWAGAPFFRRALASIRNRALNMFTLVALGVGAAYAESLAATFAPGAFPPGLRDGGGVVPVYYEAAAVITVLVLLGQVLELSARERTGGAIRALLDLAPKTARRIGAGGADEDIPLDRILVGDCLRIRPGDSVPVDGTVAEGMSAVDESMVTGESMPVEKQPGAKLIGGTINGTGALVMRAEKVGADTMLARIVRMVAEAQRSRAPIQRLADAVSSWFAPAVIAVAVVAFTAWMIWGPRPAFAYALVAAVSVVIIACPCALGLATPMSIMVGIGRGAKEGVLIRSAEALERFEQVDTIVIDKTGTLTEGRPQLIAVVPAEGFDENTILTLAASLERLSEHPLGGAIVRAAHDRGLAMRDVAGFASVTGRGVTGSVGGQRVAVGNGPLTAAAAGATPDPADRADALRRQGATVMYVTVDGRPAGILAVADPVKATTAAALDGLRKSGIRIVMVTGDNAETARAVADGLGIAEVEAGILPDGKNAIVRRLKAEGRIVAMAGDGVNDAPALAEADVGIAMGAGADVAIQSAGVTLVKGDLAGIARARALSHATMRNIRQNLVLAFVYNLVGVPLAAGALYPAFGVMLSPIVAAAAMSLSSVSVIGNALRLRLARL